VAVVNGALHGYEIKSSADNLDRLPAQVKAFDEVFDFLTLVVAGRHLRTSLAFLPPSWGVIEACDEISGVQLRRHRSPDRNDQLNPRAIAGLLWRDELLSILEDRGSDKGVRAASRAALIDRVVGALLIDDLSRVVRETIRARRSWRVGPPRTPDGATSPSAHTWSGFLGRRLEPRRPSSTDRRR
jgi:hypothetical protein